MKRRYKIATVAVLFILAISLSLNIVAAVTQNAEPGSEQDPIVSKSYVDAAINQLSAKIQSLTDQIGALKTQNTQLSTKVTNQEQTIKALQAALKEGVASSVTEPSKPGTSNPGESGGAVAAPSTLGTGVIKAAVVNLRAKPNTTSAIAGKLLLNNTVTLLSKTGNWYQVKTVSGKTGYIREDLLTVKK